MKLRPSRVLLLLLSAVVGISLMGCTNQEPGPQNDPIQLNVGATAEPLGLDPATVSGAGTPFVLLYNVYETLVRLDADGEIRPLLATEWEISDDNTVYTFVLDSGQNSLAARRSLRKRWQLPSSGSWMEPAQIPSKPRWRLLRRLWPYQRPRCR